MLPNSLTEYYGDWQDDRTAEEQENDAYCSGFLEDDADGEYLESIVAAL